MAAGQVNCNGSFVEGFVVRGLAMGVRNILIWALDYTATRCRHARSGVDLMVRAGKLTRTHGLTRSPHHPSRQLHDALRSAISAARSR